MEKIKVKIINDIVFPRRGFIKVEKLNQIGESIFALNVKQCKERFNYRYLSGGTLVDKGRFGIKSGIYEIKLSEHLNFISIEENKTDNNYDYYLFLIRGFCFSFDSSLKRIFVAEGFSERGEVVERLTLFAAKAGAIVKCINNAEKPSFFFVTESGRLIKK